MVAFGQPDGAKFNIEYLIHIQQTQSHSTSTYIKCDHIQPIKFIKFNEGDLYHIQHFNFDQQ